MACRVNWYWVRLTWVSMVRSCTGCKYSFTPGNCALCCCRRVMMAGIRSLRSLKGLRLICNRPLLSVALLPSTPTNDVRLSTAGSLRISAATCCWRSAILLNDTDCGASSVP
ncbi:hypothetical protein D3C86_1840560 [compost metagenome]